MTTTAFRKGHYDYLSDTILNDPELKNSQKLMVHGLLEVYFERDFHNFNKKKWIAERTKWMGVNHEANAKKI
jgi:hypothetical protein